MFLRRVAYIKHTNENGNAISSLFILPVLRASNKSWARGRGNYFIRNSYLGQKQIPSTVYRGYMRTYPKTIRKSEGNGRRRRDSLHFQTRENHAGMNSARSVRPLRSKRFLSLLFWTLWDLTSSHEYLKETGQPRWAREAWLRYRLCSERSASQRTTWYSELRWKICKGLQNILLVKIDGVIVLVEIPFVVVGQRVMVHVAVQQHNSYFYCFHLGSTRTVNRDPVKWEFIFIRRNRGVV